MQVVLARPEPGFTAAPDFIGGGFTGLASECAGHSALGQIPHVPRGVGRDGLAYAAFEQGLTDKAALFRFPLLGRRQGSVTSRGFQQPVECGKGNVLAVNGQDEINVAPLALGHT